MRSFTPELFAFLRDLAANNDRAWFADNKARYEESVREPALRLIEEFAPRLAEISPHFVADSRPVGGSLYRIHRDVRFSRDKSPYKTAAAITFRHELGRGTHAPVYHLHLEPGRVFAGAGVWRPDREALGRVRAAIAADPDGWRAAVGAAPFAERYSLAGDSLKRPPAGFDAAHPLIEDLKRKDVVATASLTQGDVTRGGFIDRYAEACRAASPFMGFLCRALAVPF